MADDKKKRDYFPDMEYRFFPIYFKDTEMEGIQGPVFRPSGQRLDLGDLDTIGMEEPTEVFHEDDAKTIELSTEEFDISGRIEAQKEVLGYVPCPKCDASIPITSNERPLKIKCPSCGKKGKIE